MEYLLTIADGRGVTPPNLGIAHVLVWFGYEIGHGDLHRDRRLLGQKNLRQPQLSRRWSRHRGPMNPSPASAVASRISLNSSRGC